MVSIMNRRVRIRLATKDPTFDEALIRAPGLPLDHLLPA